MRSTSIFQPFIPALIPTALAAPLRAASVLLALVLFVAPVAVAAGRVWHVSPAPLPVVPAVSQFRTIREAAEAVAPGDTVRIHTGVYREGVVITTSGTAGKPIRFEAAPQALVTVTGADRLTGWSREPGPDNVFRTDWPHRFITYDPNFTHPGDNEHRLIGRAEQVFVQGYPLRQVLRREQLSRGSFYVDLDARQVTVWSADDGDLLTNGSIVEASTRPVVWDCRGAWVTTRGICFRYAANAAQQGAAQFSGAHDSVEDCVFERTNASGAAFLAPDITVRGCTFRENGQLGFGANGAHRLHLVGCTISNNNVKGFSRGWEAGGDKIVLSRGVVVEQCRVLDNRGTGLWFDIGNEDCEVRNCWIEGNEDAGLFYEISYGLHAHDNVIIENGFAQTPGAWGAEGGLCLSSSPGCVVERNLFIANKEGFDFREQGRTTPRIGAAPGAKEEAVWNHDEVIRNNVFSANRDAQVWGWFDTPTERHWPAAIQEGARPADGSSLETLHITFSGNLYAVPSGEGLFHWGVEWRRNRAYTDLAAVRKELHLEVGSRVMPFNVADFAARDLRIPAKSAAQAMGCYPRGVVPGVRLGIAEAATPEKVKSPSRASGPVKRR